MFTEDQLLPISALQHLLFCERQCALIHVEQLWAENRLTAEGRVLHNKAHEGPDETRNDVRIVRGLKLRSFELGLYGVADVVEFQEGPRGEGRGPRDEEGSQKAFPIEYKRGKAKKDDSDRVQLCAQAMCLEEMLQADVPAGALFYGRTRRRFDVSFDETLRDTTRRAAKRLHEMIASGITPRAKREKKCDNCSMLYLCLPDALGARKSATGYLSRVLNL